MIQAIVNRRSIRKYRDRKVPKSLIEDIIMAGTLAPSAKNRQPWRFEVVMGDSKEKMLAAMEKGLKREEESPSLPESARFIKDAWNTWEIMKQAPVVIFVINPLGLGLEKELTRDERVYESCNIQSVGAAMENMTLTATELGLGSLWICNTYFAYKELTDWLNTEGELLAALAVGYADEAPSVRPRNNVQSIIEWRE